ncbi:MAG: P1 family peptidase [Eggerthellaceae bacterium]
MDPLEAFGVLAQQAARMRSRKPTRRRSVRQHYHRRVLTNARLTKAQATKASSTVHDAYARIKPVHTSGDGDTVFTFASCEEDAAFDVVAVLATEAMQGAIERAVLQAESAFGLPSARDLAARAS